MTRRLGSPVPGLVLLALGPALVGSGVAAPPAGAHVCPVSSIVQPGASVAVPVAVTVEAVAVTEVEITFPDGLRLERFGGRPGWTATRTGPMVRARGPALSPFSCEIGRAHV